MISWILSNLGLVGKIWNAIKLPLVGLLENRRGQATGRRKAALEAHKSDAERARKASDASNDVSKLDNDAVLNRLREHGNLRD